MSKCVTSCHANWESLLGRAEKPAPRDFFDLSKAKPSISPAPSRPRDDSYAASGASPYCSLLNGTSWIFSKKTA